MIGTVCRFGRERGFGFIAGDDGKQYFCHISNIDIGNGQYPEVGQKVKFEVVEKTKGPEAVRVWLI